MGVFRNQRVGASAWGDERTGSVRDRKKRRPRTPLSERPQCPGGHGPELINKAGFRRGEQLWYCYGCRKRFLPAAVNTITKCPECSSTHIEREADGTWVCWSCDWFQVEKET